MIELVESALSARRELIDAGEVAAYRVFNAHADGIPGLVIERYGPVLIVQMHEERLMLPEAQVRELAEYVHGRLGTRAVYRKLFVRDRAAAGEEVEEVHADPRPWIGGPVEPELAITEYGLQFLIHPYEGFSVGLFVEHRETRRRVHELAAGRRVLNAFSYTCAFSVAAAAGGASSVASVDMHKRYLEWGKRNFAANRIDLAAHRFYCSDVFDFFKRARRQAQSFDLIILDPPTFSRSRRPARVFIFRDELERVCRESLTVLAPEGVVLLATNDRRIPRERLEQALLDAAGPRGCTIIERPPLPADFAGDPEYSKTVIGRVGEPR